MSWPWNNIQTECLIGWLTGYNYLVDRLLGTFITDWLLLYNCYCLTVIILWIDYFYLTDCWQSNDLFERKAMHYPSLGLSKFEKDHPSVHLDNNIFWLINLDFFFIKIFFFQIFLVSFQLHCTFQLHCASIRNYTMSIVAETDSSHDLECLNLFCRIMLTPSSVSLTCF